MRADKSRAPKLLSLSRRNDSAKVPPSPAPRRWTEVCGPEANRRSMISRLVESLASGDVDGLQTPARGRPPACLRGGMHRMLIRQGIPHGLKFSGCRPK